GWPTHWLNRAVGFREANAGEVGRIAAWLRENAANGCFEIMPDRHGPGLAAALAAAGYAQTRFDSVSWGIPRRGPAYVARPDHRDRGGDGGVSRLPSRGLGNARASPR